MRRPGLTVLVCSALLLVLTGPALAEPPGETGTIVVKQVSSSHEPTPTNGKAPLTREQVQRETEQKRAYYKADARDYKGTRARTYDYITYNECIEREESSQPGGWVKNRFSWCGQYGETWVAETCNSSGCTPNGTLDMHYVVIGRGQHGPAPGSDDDRFMSYTIKVDRLVYTGLFQTPGATWTTRLNCTSSSVQKCKAGNTNASKTLTAWAANPDAYFEIIAPAAEPAAENGQQLVYADITQESNALIPGATAKGGRLDGALTSVRFDSAWYIQKNQNTGTDQIGSIFTKVNPYLVYSSNPGTGYQMVADHIATALRNPELTKPPFSNKQIPGGSWGNPIHRLARSLSDENLVRYNRNRYYSKQACNTYFPGWNIPKDPDGQTLQQCDEFPFASTYEGAARFLDDYDGPVYKDMFSARPVHRDHNGLAGRVLANWYNWDRIIDMDAYYVQVR